MKKAPCLENPLKVCSVALTLLLLCVCRVTHMQWIPQFLPKGWLPGQREGKNGCKLVLFIPLFFSLLNSPRPHTPFIFPSSSYWLFVFIPLQTIAQIFQSASSSSSSPLFFNPPPSSISMSFLAEAQLVVFNLNAPLITPHSAWGRNAANQISRMSWWPETTRWWVHWWGVGTSQVIRQIPVPFGAQSDKCGLGECWDNTHTLTIGVMMQMLHSEVSCFCKLVFIFYPRESQSI